MDLLWREISLGDVGVLPKNYLIDVLLHASLDFLGFLICIYLAIRILNRHEVNHVDIRWI